VRFSGNTHTHTHTHTEFDCRIGKKWASQIWPVEINTGNFMSKNYTKSTHEGRKKDNCNRPHFLSTVCLLGAVCLNSIASFSKQKCWCPWSVIGRESALRTKCSLGWEFLYLAKLSPTASVLSKLATRPGPAIMPVLVSSAEKNGAKWFPPLWLKGINSI
jgi:hypothetical protein